MEDEEKNDNRSFPCGNLRRNCGLDSERGTLMQSEQRIEKAIFYRKPIHVGELKQRCDERFASGFCVERIAEIPQAEFKGFQEELYGYYRVLYDNRDCMFSEPGGKGYHCLLITTPERKEGIMVEAEGYAYARYAAYIPDCGRLELDHAEVLKEASISHEIPDAYFMHHFPSEHGKMKTSEER